MSPFDLSTRSISGVFVGFLTGVVWLLLAITGVITDFFVLIGLGGVLGNILTILIALIGFLAVLVFGFFIFKLAWRHSK